MDFKNKHIFVVIGMARSGTSVIARSLLALGVDLGKELVEANQDWNPKGFYEDKEIVYQVNGKIFKTLNFQPYGIHMPDEDSQSSAKLATVKNETIALLKNRFATTDYWGFKDPSTVKVLPFWQSVFQQLNLNENYILALRNPLSVAHSYKTLTGTDLEIGLLLWLMHTVQALQGIKNKKRLVVSYEEVLSSPEPQLHRLKSFFNLETSAEKEEAFTNEFLSTNLQRHKHSSEDLTENSYIKVFPLCAELYYLLLKVAKDELTFQDDAYIQSWKSIEARLQTFYPLYNFIDSILKKNNSLTRSLKDMNKSIAWKILLPLRKLDNALRRIRKNTRNKRRLNKAYG